MDPGVTLTLVHDAPRNPCPTVDAPGWPSAEPWSEVTVRVPDATYDADGRVLVTDSEADAIREGAIGSVLRGGSINGIVLKWWHHGSVPRLPRTGRSLRGTRGLTTQ